MTYLPIPLAIFLSYILLYISSPCVVLNVVQTALFGTTKGNTNSVISFWSLIQLPQEIPFLLSLLLLKVINLLQQLTCFQFIRIFSSYTSIISLRETWRLEFPYCETFLKLLQFYTLIAYFLNNFYVLDFLKIVALQSFKLARPEKSAYRTSMSFVDFWWRACICVWQQQFCHLKMSKCWKIPSWNSQCQTEASDMMGWIHHCHEQEVRKCWSEVCGQHRKWIWQS